MYLFQFWPSVPPVVDSQGLTPHGDASSMELEAFKLGVLKELERQIKLAMGHLIEDIDSKSTEASKINDILLALIYYFLLIFGLLQDIAGSYTFASFLFALIPNVTPLTITLLSLLFTLLDSILFYAFEVSLLKDALGFTENLSE